MNWGGGKPGGTIFQRKSGQQQGAYNVVFNSVQPKVTKFFSFKTYGSEDEAYAAAVLFQVQKSLELGLTRNMYRKLPDGIYWKDDESNFPLTNNTYEVMLHNKDQGVMFMIVDEDDLKKYVLDNSICVTKSGNNENSKHYAGISFKGPRGSRDNFKKFHKWITGYEMTDHINRNPLDNRRCNLRQSDHKMNNNNRSQNVAYESDPNHVLGVRYVERDDAWQARIKQDGKEYSKNFAVKKYGADLAKKLAIDYRKKFNKQFNCRNG